MAQSYYKSCESISSGLALKSVDAANYIYFTYIHLWRARHLKTANCNKTIASWAAYRTRTVELPMWKRAVTEIVIVGTPLLVFFALVTDAFQWWWFPEQ